MFEMAGGDILYVVKRQFLIPQNVTDEDKQSHRIFDGRNFNLDRT
jgi:hypothetical protein